MSCSIASALEHNVSFITKKDCQMYLQTHTHNFPNTFVQAMSCSIASALEHNVSFITKKDCQMYLHTHTHNFPNILVQAMSCSKASALQHNVSFIKKEDGQMYLHTDTTLISLMFSFRPFCSIATASESISAHSNLVSQTFSFKQKFRKFPYKNF